MFKPKNFKLAAAEIVRLLDRPMGAGLATDHITVEGYPVGYMYREEPDGPTDSGWRFLSGHETQAYADVAEHWAFYDLNTIANYDRAVIPYLGMKIGAELERVSGSNEFQSV